MYVLHCISIRQQRIKNKIINNFVNIKIKAKVSVNNGIMLIKQDVENKNLITSETNKPEVEASSSL